MKTNKLSLLVAIVTILLYIGIVLLALPFGTPSNSHPFLYHMDEWHQLMAIKAIAKHGTTTIAGAAQIPFVYPVLSALYLIPFILLHVVNPFSVKSPLDELLMQQHLFEILRSVNIWFGVGSIIAIGIIAKRYLKSKYVLAILIFTFSPILLTLSGYFKYDIGLLFFITLSLALLFRFGEKPTLRNFLYAAIGSGFALGTKFSALPLFPLLIFAFFWYAQKKGRGYAKLFIGIGVYILTFLVVGSPNIFFGKADYRDLLYSNLISAPAGTSNYLLPYPWWIDLAIKQYPILFGHLLYILSSVAFVYFLFYLLKHKNWKIPANKNVIFLSLAYLLFILSLVSLKIGATSNRALVLLPFLSLLSTIFISRLYKRAKGIAKYIVTTIVVLIVLSQIIESATWIYTKSHSDPQTASSRWIEKNIKKGSSIAIENIPIYQSLPNLILKEFYANQYHIKGEYRYTYQVVDSKSKKLSPFVVITNDNVYEKLFRNSAKNDLVKRLRQEGYKRTAVFTPDKTFYPFFSNDVDFLLSGMIPVPLTISIYENMLEHH